jgi:adenosylcobyric acid synthase
MESSTHGAQGLALLPAQTVLATTKTTEVRTATTRGGVCFSGYEIHLGVTTVDPPCEPFARLADGRADGACADRVIGTYLHGALENADVCAEVFGVPVPAPASKAENHRRLAEWFERHGRGLSKLGLG